MNNILTRSAALLLCVCMACALLGCAAARGGAEASPAANTPAQIPAQTPKQTPLPQTTFLQGMGDVPPGRYDAAAHPRTGANATAPLIVGVPMLEGRFSPFFASCAGDAAVAAFTGLTLIGFDASGLPRAGVEIPCLAYSCSFGATGVGQGSACTFFLKNGVYFSDGTPVTAKDVLFSLYVLCDPLYDGPSALFPLNIRGLSDYRNGSDPARLIAGITSGREVCADGITRDYVRVEFEGADPAAVSALAVTVAPQHYYAAGFAGEVNACGVAPGSEAFFRALHAKDARPLGAGPYAFEAYMDGVAYYEANDGFLLGSPKIKNLRCREIVNGGELDAVLIGTVHFASPDAAPAILKAVAAGKGTYARLACAVSDHAGYGYIGINAKAVPDWNVRRALASTIDPKLAVDYFGGLATPNYRTMSRTQWAYPEGAPSAFVYDGTGQKALALFLEAGYLYDGAAKRMVYPQGHERAGAQVVFKATLPMAAEKHPAGAVFEGMQKTLAGIGVRLEIEIDPGLLEKLDHAYESGLEIVAAAWDGGGDPDMFQLWYSDPLVNFSLAPNAKGLYWLFENGDAEQRAQLERLNALILRARAAQGIETRRALYAEALALSTGLAVEIPTYQRKDLFVYNKDVIKASSLLPEEETGPYRNPLAFIWNVELNG